MKGSNAQKDDVPATSRIVMRVTEQRKERYRAVAEKQGMSMSEWIQTVLDEATEEDKNK